ncbi:alpha/beta fold hydrolase [Pedobacter sp. L105]|uniref:alpha/beta fold hydrolase n=1 Tax=Pedobacter sp. L105 TaxID=1641871 RepID=UPI00131E8DB9|nr:alpha/beta fold hydrolase [Pedobacter sp. L105]
MENHSASDHYTIHKVRTGPRGGTPVVLVHAVGLDLTLWGSQIAALQQDYDVVALDLPGHGLSEQLPGELSFTKFAAVLIRLITDLNAGPVHLAGISFGGMVIQTAALERPDLVRSLTLIGTSCTFPEPVRTALKERARFVRNEGIRALAPVSLARWFTPGFAERRPDVIDLITKILIRQEPLFHASMWDMISTLDNLEGLKQISVPAMVIVGEEDTSTPVLTAEMLSEALHTEHIHVVPNASHLVVLEAPEIINDLLLGFFASFKQ